jgi:hypothetical protein
MNVNITDKKWKMMKRLYWVGMDFFVFGVIEAILLSFIWGFNPTTTAKIYLIISMNIFAIPILLTWRFVWWVNYCIIISWILRLGVIHDLDDEDDPSSSSLSSSVSPPLSPPAVKCVICGSLNMGQNKHEGNVYCHECMYEHERSETPATNNKESD